MNQLLIALRFYATGRISLLLVNGDTFSVRQQYVVQSTKSLQLLPVCSQNMSSFQQQDKKDVT